MSLLSKLKASPPAETQVTDPVEIDRLYRYWRVQILAACFLAYAVFYFCRVNIPMALPGMANDLGYSWGQLGMITAALPIAYGIGKFANGILADRTNPRYFMGIGLLLTALVNILFGMNTILVVLIILWFINGWFQSMGFPPGARLLSHWFSPSEHGWKFSIYGCSHQVGAAIVLIMGGYIVAFGWQYIFFLPATVALVVAFFLLIRLRDIPASMGLPPVEEYRRDITDKKTIEELGRSLTVKETLLKYVLNNKYIWAVAFGNFFLYMARFGVLTWVPSYLNQAKDASIIKAGWTLGFFEIMGILGMLTAGWISDHMFKARRGPIMTIYMCVLSLGLFVFWAAPPGFTTLYVLALGVSGFLVYGPLMLVSVAAISFAGKKAAATASGFTGFWGYMGATVAVIAIGKAADTFGWQVAFSLIIAAGILSGICFALTWKIRPRYMPLES